MNLRFHGLIPKVGPRAWAIIAGSTMSATGFGVVFPFLVVYLHRVRGMDLGIAGVTLAAIAVAGFAGAPAIGTLTDRLGARRVLLAGQFFSATGVVCFAFVREPWQAIGAALLLGVGFAAWFTPELAMLATSVPVRLRSSVFALENATANLGFGLGAVLGGLFMSVSHPLSFKIGWMVTGLPILGFAVILLLMSDRAPYEDRDADQGARPTRGYRSVLGDRVFVRALLLAVILTTFSGSQLDVAFPAYATGPGGVSPRVIGFAFAANTGLIVLGQLFVLRALKGRRRTRAMMVTCVAGAAAWLVLLLAGHLGAGVMAATTVILVMMIFAIGEMFWSPSFPGMVNDLAPPALRGRYNAMTGVADGAGRIAGPAAAGFALQAGLGDETLLVMAAVTTASVLLVWNLERSMPVRANVVSDEAPGPVNPLTEV